MNRLKKISARSKPTYPHCQSDRLTSWDTREQVFKDLPIHAKRVGICVDAKQLRTLLADAIDIAAVPLGSIHGGICGPQELVGRCCAIRIDGDSDTYRNLQRRTTMFDG